MLRGKSVIRPSSANGDAFTKESSERTFSRALWLEAGNGWGVGSVPVITPCSLGGVESGRAQTSPCVQMLLINLSNVTRCSFMAKARCWKVRPLLLPRRPCKSLVSCHHAVLQPWLVSSQASHQGCSWGQSQQQFCLLQGLGGRVGRWRPMVYVLGEAAVSEPVPTD